MKKADPRPLYCLRCGAEHPCDAKACDCRVPPVPLISRNPLEMVNRLCSSHEHLIEKFTLWWLKQSDTAAEFGFGAIASIVGYSLLCAAALHDPTKQGYEGRRASFTTFAWSVIRNRIRSAQDDFRQNRKHVSFVDPIDSERSDYMNQAFAKGEPNGEPDNKEMLDKMSFCHEGLNAAVRTRLTEREQGVIFGMYIQGKSREETALAVGRSAHNVQIAKLRAIAKLKHALRPDLKVLAVRDAETGPERKTARREVRWTANLEALLGTMPDNQLAEQLGCSCKPVRQRRRKLGIPPFDRELWTDETIGLLGTITDSELATRMGVSRAAVIKARRRHNIPPFCQGGWTAAHDIARDNKRRQRELCSVG